MKNTLYALCILLTGCGAKVAPDVEIKSIDYYMEHAQETEKVINECMAFRRGKFSTMTASDQKAFMETPYATNCSNAGEATLGLRQKRLREAASKY